ncbi:CbtA family protein [Kordiimonas sp.]|uniref:CbtA family protein n=1 Tax=Kordiimonas sp. TaxID=1970157 RepID=UPI003A93E43F
MKHFTRLFVAAMLAGILAGFVHATLQNWMTVPLILEAETYEIEAHDRAELAQGSNPSEEAHSDTEEREWQPEDGFERIAFTYLSTIIGSIGFALVMGAAITAIGAPTNVQSGVLWGGALFVCFSLAPGMGLPLELPGMPGGEVTPRQIWWWGTALSTAAGLGVLAFIRRWPWILVAALLIAVPHLVGAPHPTEIGSDVPALLAAEFVARNLGVTLIFWLTLACSLAYLLRRSDILEVEAKV